MKACASPARQAGFRHAASIPCGMLRGSVHSMTRALVSAAMTDPDLQGIADFALHPDAELLCGFDHPHTHLRRWKGLLTAKAWLGRDLACFFAGQADDGGRIVVLLQGGNCFCPRLGGADMRGAVIGALYELDVFVPHGQTPIVDRAERIAVFA